MEELAQDEISIHALHEEGDISLEEASKMAKISIHALHEEGDKYERLCDRIDAVFLSTPSTRRATRRNGRSQK